jgi:hypothetical protein
VTVGCAGPRSVLASRRILCRSSLVQHPPQLSFVLGSQWWSPSRLRLEKGPQKYPIVQLGADATQVPIVQLLAQSLGLEYLGLAFTAPLAKHLVV